MALGLYDRGSHSVLFIVVVFLLAAGMMSLTYIKFLNEDKTIENLPPAVNNSAKIHKNVNNIDMQADSSSKVFICEECIKLDEYTSEPTIDIMRKMIDKYFTYDNETIIHAADDVATEGDKTVLVNQISDKYKYKLVALIYKNKLTELIKDYRGNIGVIGDDLHIAQNQVENSMVDLFGPNVSYVKETTDSYFLRCNFPSLDYKDQVYQIRFTNQCGGVGLPVSSYEITNVDVINEMMTISIKPVFYKYSLEYEIYSDSAMLNKIGTQSDYLLPDEPRTFLPDVKKTIDMFYEHLNTYDFIFKQNNNDLYLFSVQKN